MELNKNLTWVHCQPVSFVALKFSRGIHPLHRKVFRSRHARSLDVSLHWSYKDQFKTNW